jgi:hypothetical protein
MNPASAFYPLPLAAPLVAVWRKSHQLRAPSPPISPHPQSPGVERKLSFRAIPSNRGYLFCESRCPMGSKFRHIGIRRTKTLL